MENPYEGPSLGGQEENTEHRVKTYYAERRTIAEASVNGNIYNAVKKKKNNDCNLNLLIYCSF